MSEFFKQLITQLSSIWQRLTVQQKVITTALVVFTFLGLVSLMVWSKSTPASTGQHALYSNLEIDDAAAVAEQLQKSNIKFKAENDGRTIMVDKDKIYEARMALAKAGLPKSHGVGYELFDKTNLGMTDFVQKINARRALEGELQRTIEGIEEVKSARVHIVVPEPTIFLDNQKDAKASVVVKMASGRELTKEQIRGITFLVSSSVDGLKPQSISIIDYEGKLLSNPFGGSGDDATMATSQNMELEQNVEKYLSAKADQILGEVLGPAKAKVKVSVLMDFDKAEKTIEKYDPESRVVRSEEREDENVKNAPDGDQNKEKSLTNYEIDKTIEHVVGEVGTIKRLTISVAVDGKYETDKAGKATFIARTAQEMQSIEEVVKNALGYDLTRGDQISVVSMQFDNEFLRKEQNEMQKRDQWEMQMMVAKYAAIFIIAVLFILFLRYLAKTVAEAMNPPLPKLEPLGIVEEIPEEVPENVKRSSAILERVEMMSREEPVNIALIIRQWLSEPVPSTRKK
jgi:flagellar M-ring protein FliF